VALIQATRKKLFFPEIVRISNLLLSDEDDMVDSLRDAAGCGSKKSFGQVISWLWLNFKFLINLRKVILSLRGSRVER
jgi:hypothetical protein